MKLKKSIKLKYGKCETPENTVKRLEDRFSAYYRYKYFEVKFSDYLYWGGLIIDGMGYISAGKGISSMLCKASTLAEAAEESAVKDTRRLKGYVKSHQDDLENPLTIEELLANEEWITPEDIEKIKSENYAQHWVDGFSLMDNKTLKVPLEYTYDINSSNGFASGNTIEEAIVHATNEVCERKAAITVLKNKSVVPTIDMDTIDNHVIREQINFIQSKNIELYVKDLSLDGSLPCIGIYCINHNFPDGIQGHRVLQVGSSFNTEEALMRAFTEYTQERKADGFTNPSQLDRLECLGDDTDNFRQFFRSNFIPYDNSDFLKEGEVIEFDKGIVYPDCLDDIEKFKDMCRTLDKDYIVVDMTDPAIDFPVVRVIIPGFSDILSYHPRTSNVIFDGWQK